MRVIRLVSSPGVLRGRQTRPPASPQCCQHREQQQHHAALPYQSVPAFITALQTADASESIRLAFELLILTLALTTVPERDALKSILSQGLT